MQNQTLIANSAQQVLDFYEVLHKVENTSIYPETSFIDLVMPVMDGLEFLDEFVRKYLCFFITCLLRAL